MSIKRQFSILILFLFLISCSNRPIGSPYSFGREEFVKDSFIISKGKKDINANVDGEKEDLIIDGDIFEISVFNPFPHTWIDHLKSQNEKNCFIVIQEKINIPFFGSVTLHNTTLLDAIDKIKKLIVSEFPEAICMIRLKDRLNKYIEIQGVINCSVPLIEKNNSLCYLINHLKIPKEVSLYNSYIKRNGEILPVDLEKIVNQKEENKDIILQSKDILYLADMSCSKVMVLGEVKKEGVISIDSSTVPLKEIIARSGGIQLSANKLFIQVIRGGMDHPKVYTLHYEDILRSPNKSMLLVQGDIVYVAATPIAEWNRLINQLLPSVTAYEFFNKGIQGVIIQ